MRNCRFRLADTTSYQVHLKDIKSSLHSHCQNCGKYIKIDSQAVIDGIIILSFSTTRLRKKLASPNHAILFAKHDRMKLFLCQPIFTKIKSHSGIVLNEALDVLAKAAAKAPAILYILAH